MHDTVAKHPTARKFRRADRGLKVLVLFGTRPEAIKLAPVIHELKRHHFRTIVVCSSQHKQILAPLLETLEIDIDFDLAVMKRNQSPNDVSAKVVARLDHILNLEKPDILLVQGDTSTALAGALAAFNRRIPVGHVEAGLRSGDLMSPFPEEMNRRLISQIATLHFAATEENRRNLVSEDVAPEKIYVTGNPVVDSLNQMLKVLEPSSRVRDLLAATKGQKRILLTTHRRESFGETMSGNLKVLRDFVAKYRDVTLLFPVHPNPNVRRVAKEILGNRTDVHLLEPLDYSEFLSIMRAAWLIVSDSGGVQEEAPSLGKPLLVIRENTERPEAISAGTAKLAACHVELGRLLEETYAAGSFIRSEQALVNPFGDGRAASRIVTLIEEKTQAPIRRVALQATNSN